MLGAGPSPRLALCHVRRPPRGRLPNPRERNATESSHRGELFRTALPEDHAATGRAPCKDTRKNHRADRRCFPARSSTVRGKSTAARNRNRSRCRTSSRVRASVVDGCAGSRGVCGVGAMGFLLRIARAVCRLATRSRSPSGSLAVSSTCGHQGPHQDQSFRRLKRGRRENGKHRLILAR